MRKHARQSKPGRKQHSGFSFRRQWVCLRQKKTALQTENNAKNDLAQRLEIVLGSFQVHSKKLKIIDLFLICRQCSVEVT